MYQHYYELVNSHLYEKITARQLAVAAKVSRGYAHNVLKEIQTYGVILHPTLKNKKKRNRIFNWDYKGRGALPFVPANQKNESYSTFL